MAEEVVLHLAPLTRCGDPNDAQHIWCHGQLVKLREFHDAIDEAYRAAKATTRPGSTFFFGQKLRRLVREALEKFDGVKR